MEPKRRGGKYIGGVCMIMMSGRLGYAMYMDPDMEVSGCIA